MSNAKARTLLCKYCDCGKCGKQIETLWTKEGKRVTGVPGRFMEHAKYPDHLRPLCLDCFWKREIELDIENI